MQAGFEDLVSRTYDAALEPAMWTDIVPRLGAFVGPRRCSSRRSRPSAYGVGDAWTRAMDPERVAAFRCEGVVNASIYTRASLVPPEGSVHDLRAPGGGRILMQDVVAATLLVPLGLVEGHCGTILRSIPRRRSPV